MNFESIYCFSENGIIYYSTLYFEIYVAIATAKAIQIVVPHLESPKYKFLLNISNLIFILFLFNLE